MVWKAKAGKQMKANVRKEAKAGNQMCPDMKAWGEVA